MTNTDTNGSRIASDTQRLSLDAFKFSIASAEKIGTGSVLQIDAAGHAWPLSIKVNQRPKGNGAGCPVVFCFHGAIDREKREVPVFEGSFLKSTRPENAWIFSIADPILEQHAALRTTWYAGSESLDTPRLIAEVVAAAVEALSPSRVVFCATSTGAHAALRHSWEWPESVAVVSNPISQISNFYRSHIGEYRQACWPSLSDSDPWPSHFVDAVANLYTKSCNNNVIYLNNASDHHFWLQAVPFLNSVRRSDIRKRLMFLSDFHASHGGHATPPRVLARWVVAACEAQSTSVEDIARRADELAAAANPLTQARAQTAVPSGKTEGRRESTGPSSQDLDIARKILESIQ